MQTTQGEGRGMGAERLMSIDFHLLLLDLGFPESLRSSVQGLGFSV